MDEITKVGGWQSLDCTTVYDNPWISVTHENVRTPAGTSGIYGVVHFKNVAVGILPIDKDGFTWLVKQSRYPLNGYTWEIPEGGAPFSESPLIAAQRELEEETGLVAEHWQEWLRLHTSNSVTDEQAIIYLAKGLSEGTMALEDTEDIEVLRLPLTDAIAMVYRAEITDAMSVAALLKAAASPELIG